MEGWSGALTEDRQLSGEAAVPHTVKTDQLNSEAPSTGLDRAMESSRAKSTETIIFSPAGPALTAPTPAGEIKAVSRANITSPAPKSSQEPEVTEVKGQNEEKLFVNPKESSIKSTAGLEKEEGGAGLKEPSAAVIETNSGSTLVSKEKPAEELDHRKRPQPEEENSGERDGELESEIEDPEDSVLPHEEVSHRAEAEQKSPELPFHPDPSREREDGQRELDPEDHGGIEDHLVCQDFLDQKETKAILESWVRLEQLAIEARLDPLECQQS
ncbi:hypothetical protein AOLI_G00072860 [Acnodon oligacanthus]